MRFTLPIFALGLAACQQTPSFPDVEGRGLVSWDREAPAGITSYPRPEWRVGDRFVYERGGQVRLAFRVTEKTDELYRLVDEQSGLFTLYSRDLGERGQEKPEEPELARVLDPEDSLFHWPLWPGKRWSCHFTVGAPGEAGVPLQADYHCDLVEEITVPAGTFSCLRIWRRTRLAAQGDFVERVALLWYAPEVGFFVRRLDESLLIELQEYQRQ